jgi:hypothetical protein
MKPSQAKLTEMDRMDRMKGFGFDLKTVLFIYPVYPVHPC